MARIARDVRLETRDARARLKVRHDPYWRSIHPGLAVGYRKGPRGGVWLVRKLEGGSYVKQTLGPADDFADADDSDALSFREAQMAAIRFGDAPTATRHVSSNPTVATVMDEYLRTHKARSRAWRETERAANAHILPAFGRRRVDDLTTTEIRHWHEKLATTPPTNRGKVMPFDPTDPEQVRRRQATANRVLTVLKAALNFAWQEGHAASTDAWRRVKPFRNADAPKVRYLNEDEIRRLINACTPEFRPLVQAALLTGCRYGELVRLRVEDYNPDAGAVHIIESKSGKARHVPLTDDGERLLSDLAAGRAAHERLFLRPNGEPWGKSHQFRPLREACTRAGIDPPIAFHDLRHSYASMLAMRGVPLQIIATALGHADTRMTMRHYAHLMPSYVADTIRANLPSLGVEASNVTTMKKSSKRNLGAVKDSRQPYGGDV